MSANLRLSGRGIPPRIALFRSRPVASAAPSDLSRFCFAISSSLSSLPFLCGSAWAPVPPSDAADPTARGDPFWEAAASLDPSSMVGPAAVAKLGILAACVLLLVPLGLSGWHLGRNKVLIFSGALFISLAVTVTVHLVPHLPSMSVLLLSYLSPSSSDLKPKSPSTALSFSCIPFLHDIDWYREYPSSPPTWRWAPPTHAAACGFQRLTRADASDLLNGSWILVAGDSQARLLALALLRLLLDPAALPPVEADLFRRHSDYHTVLPAHGLSLDFVWAPFEHNLTALLRDLPHSHPRRPDVLVLGSGLWHMLHFTNSSHYSKSLVSLKDAAEALLSSAPLKQPHMFWVGLPTLVNSMLNTEQKRARMNAVVCEEYNRKVRESSILRSSGGPFRLLDVGLLSRGCGRWCTVDGMHYDSAVYEAALHITLHALLIEPQ